MGIFTDVISNVVSDLVNRYKTLVNNVFDEGLKVTGTINNAIQAVLDTTIYNDLTSKLNNLFNSIVGEVTNFNPAFLQDKTPVIAPSHQDLSKTPTVTEFLQSAMAVLDYKAIPDGAKPFLYNGQQLGIVDSATGMAAKVYVTAENQVIIAYQATTGGITGNTNPVTVFTQTLQDVGIAAKIATPGERDALLFAQFVAHEAQKQGYSTNDIFVTGHSLGAIEAEYVAQQTGLGGIAFDGTGIPLSGLGNGDGSNFINVLQYGDPVSSYSSDVQGEQPFAPAYSPKGGDLPHYGQKVFVGSVDDQKWLSTVSQNEWGAGTITGKLQAASDYLNKGFPNFHMPTHVAANLGVDLSLKTFSIANGKTQYLSTPSWVAQQYKNSLSTPVHGAVLKAGNETIQQFLIADTLRTDYHSAILPVAAVV